MRGGVVLALLTRAIAAASAAGAFGRRQGKPAGVADAALDPSQFAFRANVPVCEAPLLPTAEGKCGFNYEEGQAYLPDQAIVSAQGRKRVQPWTSDAAKLLAQAAALQSPASCSDAKWSVVRLPYKYGVAGALQHFLLVAAGHWDLGRGVFVPPHDKWGWTAIDDTMPDCPFLFGCYFKPFQACSAAQVNRANAVVFKQRSLRDPGVPQSLGDYCAGAAAAGQFDLDAGLCPGEDPKAKGYSIKYKRWFGQKLPNSWFEKRWGGMLYESVLMNKLWDPTPAYQAKLDAFTKSVGVGQHPCIGIHVRRGDACTTNWRKCHTFDEYMQVAIQMRRKYGLKHIYLATDDEKITSAESLAKYPGFEFMYQKMDRSIYSGKDQGTWVEHKMEKLGRSAMHDVMKDIHATSRCDAFVGTFFAHIGRVVLELMIQRKGFVPPYVALDTPFCRKFAHCQVSNAQLRSRLHSKGATAVSQEKKGEVEPPAVLTSGAWTAETALAVHRWKKTHAAHIAGAEQAQPKATASSTKSYDNNLAPSAALPFSAADDARWQPLLREGRIVNIKKLPIKYTSHVLWRVELSSARSTKEYGIFRSAVQGNQAINEVAAYRLDRLLRVYRTPPAVGRCIELDVVKRTAPDLLGPVQKMLGAGKTHVCGSMVMYVEGLRGWPEKCEQLQASLCQTCSDTATQRALGDMGFFDYIVLLRDRNIFKETWPEPLPTRCSACAGKQGLYLTNFFCKRDLKGREQLMLMDNGAAFGREPPVQTRLLAFDGLCPSAAFAAAIKTASEGDWQPKFREQTKLDEAAFGAPLLSHRGAAAVKDRLESAAYHVGASCKADSARWFAAIAKAGPQVVKQNEYNKAFVGRFDGKKLQNRGR